MTVYEVLYFYWFMMVGGALFGMLWSMLFHWLKW